MAKYDDASWHYEGDYPDDLPEDNAATHIGMFLTWCIEKDLMSDFQIEESVEDIRKLLRHEITGAIFLINNCDEQFTNEDLNVLGNEFASDYYSDDSDFSVKYGSYTNDYSDTFDEIAERKGTEYETIYHVQDTFENYGILKPVIDRRFEEWKIYRGK